jgi:hypothetical protein
MTELNFKPEDIQRLVQVANAAKSQRLLIADLFDSKLWKDGAKPNEDNRVDVHDIDFAKVAPKLWLFKTRKGCFLVTNSADDGDERFHVHPEGCGPDTPREELDAKLGAEDIIEAIDIAHFEAALKNKPYAISIQISERAIAVVSSHDS